MSGANPTLIVHVSLTGSERDYDEIVTFSQHDFRIVRMGTNGDVAAAETLVRKWAEEAAAIAVTGIREARAAGLYDGELEVIERVRGATTAVPVTDGHALLDVLQEWAIRHVQTEMPGFFNNARTVVLGGVNHDRTTRILREFTQNLEFADPLLRLDLPAKLAANPILGLAASLAGRSRRRRGSANSRFWVNSRRIRVVRSWFTPPRTTVRALLKNPGISVCTCRIAHS